MLHEESLPLAMELEVDGIAVEILHSSSDLNDRVLVICKLGKIPSVHQDYGLKMLMKENINNMRMHAEWYGISAENKEVCLLFHKELTDITPQGILQDMKNLIANSANWETRFFDPAPQRFEMAVEFQKSTLA